MSFKGCSVIIFCVECTENGDLLADIQGPEGPDGEFRVQFDTQDPGWLEPWLDVFLEIFTLMPDRGCVFLCRRGHAAAG